MTEKKSRLTTFRLLGGDVAGSAQTVTAWAGRAFTVCELLPNHKGVKVAIVRRFLEGYGDVAGALVVLVVLVAVAWIGVREGRGQVYAGQIRTLAELRATAQRLGRAIVHMSRSVTFAPAFLEDWDALERGLRDLEPPAGGLLDRVKLRDDPPADL